MELLLGRVMKNSEPNMIATGGVEWESHPFYSFFRSPELTQELNDSGYPNHLIR